MRAPSPSWPPRRHRHLPGSRPGLVGRPARGGRRQPRARPRSTPSTAATSSPRCGSRPACGATGSRAGGCPRDASSSARAMALPGAEAATCCGSARSTRPRGLAYWAGDMACGQRHLRGGAGAGASGSATDPARPWPCSTSSSRGSIAGDIDGAMAAKAAAETIYRELGDDFGAGPRRAVWLPHPPGSRPRSGRPPEASMAELAARAAAIEALDDPWLSGGASPTGASRPSRR